MEAIKIMFMKGVATKEQYAEALKGYKAQSRKLRLRVNERDEARA